MKNKYLVTIFAFVFLNIFVSFFYIGYSHDLGKKDSYEYLGAAKFLQSGQIEPDLQINRVLNTPLFLYSSIFVNKFFNDFSTSFAIVNVIFYILCSLAFYFFVLEIYKEEKVAFLSTLLVAFNFYVIEPGNSHLADFGGWFFFILTTYFAIKYISNSGRKFYYLSVLVSAIGVLFKEYGGLGLVNLALLVLFSDFPIKQKIKDIVFSTFMFIVPLLSYHVFIYLKYHFSYFDWYKTVGVMSAKPGYKAKGLVILIKVLGWVFSFGWFAFFCGVWQEFKIKDKRRIKILLAILPVTLTFYLWPAITQRLAVMFMMWLAIVAGFGLSRLRWYVLYPFLLLYITFNYNVNILIKIINLPF